MGQSAMHQVGMNKMNNYNTPNQSNNVQHFQFHPQITTFSINQVDEEEIPEEKMHCLVFSCIFLSGF